MTGQRPCVASGNPKCQYLLLFPWGPFIFYGRGSLISQGLAVRKKGGRVRRQEAGIQGADDGINHSTFQMGCVIGILCKGTGKKKGKMGR